MKKIKEALSDKFTTIPAAITAIFAFLKMFNLIPDSISTQLPATLTEVVLGILSLFVMFKTKKV